MALDSDAKRLAAMDIGSPWRGLLPLPVATIDAADRLQFLFLAREPLADEPPEPPSGVGSPFAMYYTGRGR
ncbi:MAG TPA: hypothetical protein VJ816_04790 [Gemmatimonadales bacterium]|nr:hypothetical protein [Gemmatimonadales bacterium]